MTGLVLVAAMALGVTQAELNVAKNLCNQQRQASFDASFEALVAWGEISAAIANDPGSEPGYTASLQWLADTWQAQNDLAEAAHQQGETKRSHAMINELDPDFWSLALEEWEDAYLSFVAATYFHNQNAGLDDQLDWLWEQYFMSV